MKLKYEIRLLSDYHIGAGYGKGVVDSAVLKDKDGLPIIRGTTLTGLLRQGVWELLQTDLLSHHRKCRQSESKGASMRSYCMEKDPNLTCPLCRILGTPHHFGKWNLSTARIKTPDIFKQEKIVWRNRVNPRTGTAEEGKLFNEETVGGGIIFEFTMEKDTNDMSAIEEAAFITAAFRMIRNIGRSRRRGKGLCQINLVELSPKLPELKGITASSPEDTLLEAFRVKWLEQKKLETIAQDRKGEINRRNGTFPVENFNKKRRKSFNLVLLNKEPIIISNKREAGNQFQTSDYIPGPTILGALAWKAAHRNDLNNKQIYEQFSNFFLRGGVKVTPLYRCLQIGNDVYPTIPSPLDFLTCKLYPGLERWNHGAKGYATIKEEPKSCDRCLSGLLLETPLQPLNKYVPLHSTDKTVEVGKKEEMHITIDPKTGRTKTGDLFSYAVMEEGQYFVGTIDVEDWGNFAALLGIDDCSLDEISLELRIGKASSRGYGLARIWLNEGDIATTFHGKPIEKRVEEVSKPITMTLLSDAILIDKWGRFYNTFDSEILGQILGVEVEVINAYVKNKNVEGFNTYLGLPKWRDNAIAAGSSVGFTVKGLTELDGFRERLKELEKEGLGLRREEGFGKIAFNHPVYHYNSGIGERIHLPEFMRIKKPVQKIKMFEHEWQVYLRKNLHQDYFSQDQWNAVSRWLKENSKKPLIEIKERFTEFHKPEKLMELIYSKRSSRDKKMFLENEGRVVQGKDFLEKAFVELERRMEQIEIANESGTIKEYLQSGAIEMLADYIEFLREGEK